jgi:hypothetical protein
MSSRIGGGKHGGVGLVKSTPHSGTLPSQFLAIIDSERCARLPKLLARSR